MYVSKIGNEQVVRLPAEFVEGEQLREGDEVMVTPAIHRPALRPREDIRAMLEVIREMGPLFPAGYKFDREEATER